VKRLTLTALLFFAAIPPVLAQQPSKTPMQIIEEERKSQRAQTDRLYEEAQRARKAGTEERKSDPWASVRSSEEPPKKREKKKAPKP
jgi:hypothetical protein